jgi:hypothetical protein
LETRSFGRRCGGIGRHDRAESRSSMQGVETMIRSDHPSWKKLITGELKPKFANASASMLFFNLQMQHRRDPSKLREHIGEAQRFFQKYEKVLAEDIQIIFR